MKNRFLFIRLLALAAVFLSACAIVREPAPPIPLQAVKPEAEYLLALLEKRNEAVRTLEGKLHNKIINSTGKKASSQLILLKKPSSLRIDVLTPFGNPALTLVTDGERVDLHYHSKNRFFSGLAGSRRLARMLASNLAVKDLVVILSGEIPLIDFDNDKTTVNIEGRLFKLGLENSGAREEIFFEPSGMHPVKGIIYGPEDKTVLSVTLEDYKEVEGTGFPMSIDLSIPAENYEMKIKYESVVFNEYTGSEAFDLIPPEGVLIENFDYLNF